MTDKTHTKERTIAHLDKLHSSPQVASRVLSLLRRDDFAVGELVALLEVEPALAASILRLVNSSAYGLRHNVSSLHQAVTLLGPRTLRLAVLSFGLLRQLNENTPARVYQRYWKRSLTMAAAAAQIADYDCTVAKDVAYSAGLLADIGVLVLAQVHTDEYIAIYEQDPRPATLICQEEERFGFNHADLGAYLLGKWNLPEDLCHAVMQHHAPPLSVSGLDFAVAASDVVATSLWTPDSASVMTAQQLLEESISIDVDGFISLAIDIQLSIQENAELFSVSIDETIDCDKLLEAANKQSLGVLNETPG